MKNIKQEAIKQKLEECSEEQLDMLISMFNVSDYDLEIAEKIISIRKDMDDRMKEFRDGKINFNEIREWMTNNYFKHGGRYKSNELVKIATGEELNPENWLEYIKNKFNIEGE